MSNIFWPPIELTTPVQKWVVASGYFNPLGEHHLNYLDAARKMGRLLVVVNNDEQVKLKGSVPFMPEEERLRIISSLAGVWKAVLSVDGDGTVCKTLRLLRAVGLCDIFVNGGDVMTCREEKICREMGVEVVYGVGGAVKTNSSSGIIERAAKAFWEKRLGCGFVDTTV